MNVFKNWAISVCGACLISALIHYFIPSFKFEKVIKIGLVAFLMIAVVMPFTGANKPNISAFFESEVNASSLQKQGEDLLTKSVLNASAAQVKEVLEQALQKKGFAFSKIDVSMHTDRQNNIYINEITLFGVEEKARQRVHDYIKKNFDLEVTVC